MAQISNVPSDARIWAELFVDEEGGAHFICHTKDEDFEATKRAFKQFIAIIQRQLDYKEQCPFYDGANGNIGSVLDPQNPHNFKRRSSDVKS